MAKGMDLSRAPHNWHKRQFQKRATNIFISNSCIGACVLLPKVPSLKDNVHLDMGGLMGILKTCLVTWGSNLHLEEMGGRCWRKGWEAAISGFYGVLCWSPCTVRSNLLHLGGMSHAWGAEWQPAQECGTSLLKTPTFSTLPILWWGEMIKDNIVSFVCPPNPHKRFFPIRWEKVYLMKIPDDVKPK